VVDVREEYFFALLDRLVCYHKLPFPTKFDVGVWVARVVEEVTWEEKSGSDSDLLCVGYAARVGFYGKVEVEDKLEVLWGDL
jgi:hypothetical protein